MSLPHLSSPSHTHPNTYVDLPSLQQIEEMEQQQARFIAALEIDDQQKTVKCQACDSWWPISQVETNFVPRYSGRIYELEKRLVVLELA
jgi:hypothetical protein